MIDLRREWLTGETALGSTVRFDVLSTPGDRRFEVVPSELVMVGDRFSRMARYRTSDFVDDHLDISASGHHLATTCVGVIVSVASTSTEWSAVLELTGC